jgi:hypothetical protein
VPVAHKRRSRAHVLGEDVYSTTDDAGIDLEVKLRESRWIEFPFIASCRFRRTGWSSSRGIKSNAVHWNSLEGTVGDNSCRLCKVDTSLKK